jgi:two-component system CheB/CheR fusion protein
VVLLDISLPEMDGHEVARRLRSLQGDGDGRGTGDGQGDSQGDGNGRVVPLIVAVTGFGREEDVRRSLEAGFDRHLTKPVDPEQVLALINTTNGT